MRAFVVFDLVLFYGVIVVSSCCRRCHNNLNEPLDPFPFLGGLTLIYRWPSFTG